MSIAVAVKHMLSAGMAPDAIVAAVAEMEAAAVPDAKDEQAERRRAADRERKRLERLRKSAESADSLSPKKEKSPTPPKEKTTPIPETSLRSVSAPAKPSPRLILLTVLAPEIADAVIDHRRKKRSPLTNLAAEGLAKAFDATGDPEAAARMMIERGWSGFKLEWWENDRQSKTNQQRKGPAQRGSFGDVFAGLAGLPPQWAGDGRGREADDLRRQGAGGGAAGEIGGPPRTIEGRAIAIP